MIDDAVLLKDSFYSDELTIIAKTLEALNGSNYLMDLDGSLVRYNENGNDLATFWYDAGAEAWRVYIHGGSK